MTHQQPDEYLMELQTTCIHVEQAAEQDGWNRSPSLWVIQLDPFTVDLVALCNDRPEVELVGRNAPDGKDAAVAMYVTCSEPDTDPDKRHLVAVTSGGEWMKVERHRGQDAISTGFAETGTMHGALLHALRRFIGAPFRGRHPTPRQWATQQVLLESVLKLLDEGRATPPAVADIIVAVADTFRDDSNPLMQFDLPQIGRGVAPAPPLDFTWDDALAEAQREEEESDEEEPELDALWRAWIDAAGYADQAVEGEDRAGYVDFLLNEVPADRRAECVTALDTIGMTLD